MRSRAKTKAAAGGNRCGQGRLDGVGMDLSGSPVSHVAFMIPQNPAAVKCHGGVPTPQELDRLRQEAERLRRGDYKAYWRARWRFLLAQGAWYRRWRGESGRNGR